jgi:hypothetical protein
VAKHAAAAYCVFGPTERIVLEGQRLDGGRVRGKEQTPRIAVPLPLSCRLLAGLAESRHGYATVEKRKDRIAMWGW